MVERKADQFGHMIAFWKRRFSFAQEQIVTLLRQADADASAELQDAAARSARVRAEIHAGYAKRLAAAIDKGFFSEESLAAGRAAFPAEERRAAWLPPEAREADDDKIPF